MIVIFISVILVLIILVNWFNLINESNKISARGPFPLPILGNAHLFMVDASEFLNLILNFSIKYGDAVRVHFFSRPHVIPILLSTELITKGQSYRFLDSWLGQGLVTSTGNRWRTHRKLLTPAFHFNILQNFLPVFCKNQRILTEKLRERAKKGKPIDLLPLVALAALDNVIESIMGVSMEVQKNEESNYVKSTDMMANIVSSRMQIPFLGLEMLFNILPLKKQQDKALEVLHGQTRKVIQMRRDELNKANITSLATHSDIGMKNKHAFLDLLLLSEINGEKIDEEGVREEVDTFMFEGHDTTTSGIVYTLFALSKHRDVQEKIYEELKTIYGGNMDKDPSYQELQQMKYLDLVLKESMRLYPPVPFIERLMENDCEVGELKLVKGTSVLINIHQIQRHPELYENPLKFRPERFKVPLPNPFNWIAFSAGPRNCIGQKFAMMELKIAISETVKNFLILPSGIEPKSTAVLILKSQNGVHVKLRPRN
ncbi:unnamed protein product [Arctia plantaginis]|uniref:Cytochrome P450 n=1 Tax=Arctia plantaginis TaxID=874455 RepID=A0A8S1BAV1_ARCPL|nr:unnamed protein product [Arctia plantaginis]